MDVVDKIKDCQDRPSRPADIGNVPEEDVVIKSVRVRK